MQEPSSVVARWLAAGDAGDVDAFDDLLHFVTEVVSDGSVEMARVVVTGTLVHDFGGVAGQGRTFRMDQAVICHLRDGKIAEAWEIADVGALDDQADS